MRCVYVCINVCVQCMCVYVQWIVCMCVSVINVYMCAFVCVWGLYAYNAYVCVYHICVVLFVVHTYMMPRPYTHTVIAPI